MIAAYAVGASRGYIYVRGEYPYAFRIMSDAVAEARQAGIIGENIFGSGLGFDIEMRLGAGAYICGEETALLESIEGKRGLPRIKPPFPTTHGLFGKPTVINNVETFCNVAADHRTGRRTSIANWAQKDRPAQSFFACRAKSSGPGFMRCLSASLYVICFLISPAD